MLASSMVKHGFKSQSSQAIDYKIGICCFYTKYTALWSKKKRLVGWNQDSVSEWNDMSTCGLLFQWYSTIKIQQNVLV
jgi:hypothetical protein